MNANPKFLAATAHVDDAAIHPLPNSRKVYVGPLRVPMREVYQMFRGTLAPEQVLSAAGSQPAALFYAHLYVGLYFEAQGMTARALEHIKIAAADRFEREGGYMHMVARVHARRS